MGKVEEMMQTMKFKVANVKCGSCVAIVREGLAQLPGVSQVLVEVSSGEVEVQGDALVSELLTSKLTELGYPLVSR